LALPNVRTRRKVLEVTSTLAPIADRLSKLIRLLSSDRDGEVVATARAIRRTLRSEVRDVHALAEQVKSPLGSFNEAEAHKLYDAGHEQGYQAAISTNERACFHDVSSPLSSGHDTARWCRQRSERLGSREREFIDQMTAQTLRREPSERQGRWLKSIFYRLGGK
jgi:hypothetical protein